MVKWNDYAFYLNSQDKSKTNSTGERPSWPVECEVERSLASAPYAVPHGKRSSPAATEPPVFHPPPGMVSKLLGQE